MQKERDLELAARIGQSLLKKNKALSERNELLEEQVEHIREEVHSEGIIYMVSVGLEQYNIFTVAISSFTVSIFYLHVYFFNI